VANATEVCVCQLHQPQHRTLYPSPPLPRPDALQSWNTSQPTLQLAAMNLGAPLHQAARSRAIYIHLNRTGYP